MAQVGSETFVAMKFPPGVVVPMALVMIEAASGVEVEVGLRSE